MRAKELIRALKNVGSRLCKTEKHKPGVTIQVSSDFYNDEDFIDRLSERIQAAVKNRHAPCA